jgi:hypothetical protein
MSYRIVGSGRKTVIGFTSHCIRLARPSKVSIRQGAAMLIAAASLACLAPAHAQAPRAVDEFARLQEDLRRTHAGGDAGSYLAASGAMYAFLHGSPQATLHL